MTSAAAISESILYQILYWNTLKSFERNQVLREERLDVGALLLALLVLGAIQGLFFGHKSVIWYFTSTS